MMKHPVSRELYRYWNTLRGSRAAPERGDLDPAEIRGILADTFVLEVTAGRLGQPMGFPIRLSGTRLNALFLEELKSRSMPTLWAENDRGALGEILRNVLDHAEVTVAGAQAAPAGYPMLGLELLLLPLRHHGKTHARILGSLAPIAVPSWLGLLPVEPLRLVSFRDVPRERRSEGLVFAKAAAAPIAMPEMRHGRFLVYDGGR